MASYKRELSVLDQVRNLAELALLSLALLAWLIFGPEFLALHIFVPCSFVVILFHQRMMSEWMHEASHWNILKNRKANDLAANLLIFPFLGVTVEINRAHHFKHHNYTQFFVDGDPDTESHIVETRKQFWLHVLAALCGIIAIRMFLTWVSVGRTMGRPAERQTLKSGQGGKFFLLLVLHFGLFITSVLWGYWYIYPAYFGILMTIYPIFQTFRAWGQHATVRMDGTAFLVDSSTSRTMYGGILEKIFFNSSVMAYHHEHHRWPGLPFRQLARIAEPNEDVNCNGSGCLSIIKSVWRGLK